LWVHQILQWHHPVKYCKPLPGDTIAELKINALADEFFHLTTYPRDHDLEGRLVSVLYLFDQGYKVQGFGEFGQAGGM
jgi:uncharacterized membrane protein